MRTRYKALIMIGLPFVIGFLAGLATGGGCSKRDIEQEIAQTQVLDSLDINEELAEDEEAVADSLEEDLDGTGEAQTVEILYPGSRPSYSKLFADKNEEHIAKAKTLGIKSIPESRENIDPQTGLVTIHDGEYYVIDDLRYSAPYLTKGGVKELESIAKAFSDSLESKQLLDYKLIVSSVLRTEEDVRKLRKSGNPNASDNSSHCYGTTFDITYTRYFREEETKEFMQPYELTKVLGEVLRDQKKAGRCLVKYERREHCFHITSCLPS